MEETVPQAVSPAIQGLGGPKLENLPRRGCEHISADGKHGQCGVVVQRVVDVVIGQGTFPLSNQSHAW